jgi:hypothetical protein
MLLAQAVEIAYLIYAITGSKSRQKTGDIKIASLTY